MMQRVFVLALLLAFSALVGKGWHAARCGFQIQRVRTALPLEGTDVSVAPPASVREALSQPYSYLGQGRQCYAFASADGKFVLKLPRLDRYEVPLWLPLCLEVCRFPFLRGICEKMRADRRQRLQFLIESVEIAFQELKESTAVQWVHFHETDSIRATAVVTDRLGRAYRLDLDRTPFILQEKKPLMAEAFSSVLERGDGSAARDILSSFMRLVAARSRRGIYNKDHHSLLRNYGYDAGKGYEIDVGSFYWAKGNEARSSFEETMENICRWLQTVDPDLSGWAASEASRLANEERMAR